MAVWGQNKPWQQCLDLSNLFVYQVRGKPSRENPRVPLERLLGVSINPGGGAQGRWPTIFLRFAVSLLVKTVDSFEQGQSG